jgi:hypothetical protein
MLLLPSEVLTRPFTSKMQLQQRIQHSHAQAVGGAQRPAHRHCLRCSAAAAPSTSDTASSTAAALKSDIIKLSGSKYGHDLPETTRQQVTATSPLRGGGQASDLHCVAVQHNLRVLCTAISITSHLCLGVSRPGNASRCAGATCAWQQTACHICHRVITQHAAVHPALKCMHDSY